MTAALLTLLRAAPEPSAVAKVFNQLDAQALVSQARRHALSAVVAHALDSAKQTLKGPAATELRADARSVIAGSLKLKRLLLQSLDALASANINAVVLKGHGIAQRWYAEPLARPTSDVDLLVHPDDLPRAEHVFESLGLRRTDVPGEAAAFENHHHIAFHGPAGTVELHFHAISGMNHLLTWDAIGDRFVTGAIEGRSVRYLGPEDELAYLAIHAAQHLFLRVGWLFDLKLLVRAHPRLDLQRVVRTARICGMERAVAVGLEIGRRAVGLELQAGLVESLGAPLWQRRLFGSVFDDDELMRVALAQSRVPGFLFRTALCESPLAMIRYTARGAVRWGRQHFR